ncbi:RpnC/YadD family protein [Tissierella creatinophila]|uniref:Uncharacterized protein n=1 Tax=Tissierella creatinophila DSM 6911 TaxID=1123403 RepID=A0A1U7M5Z4_TISCR|nr:hypothetical protein [Tissierella creatinophila]OLS02608.1 hypothetical protein TICRE_14090 [Tissierella creatinophila DSM 6911]
MAKTDIPSKRLIQLRPYDWAKVALKDNSEIRLTEMKPEKNPKVESRLDSLFWIDNDKESFILNIEPQGYYEASLPARMLRYRSDVWEYTISKGIGTPSIKQVVVFFYQKDDNKIYGLKDERSDDSKIIFSYDVIKIWELKKDYIIDNNLIGLYSLLPLMEIEPGETDDEIIEKSVKTIETIEDEALRGDSLAAMSIMSADRYSSTLIKKYVRREMLMNSSLFEEWIDEERKEAAEKATKEAIKNNNKEKIIETLELKFDFISKDTREYIKSIDDNDILNRLFAKAIKVVRIEDFEELLEKIKNLN